ncbi:hypothetical protein DDV96_03110 [Marixanthomonas spongiae]|uniref:Uncharacterized protein n=2 Tax=Marixanthomonas spongiae TaxID=2174845 RepID=A0A2U0I590_9FLAO|nr:hypothetical protein DDV96_03110 [Marixanthomonas spongiae]
MGCSKDDDQSDDSNNASKNQITFDISGAVEGKKTGSSYIVIVEGVNYSISNNDGTSIDDQTFSLSFYKKFKDNSTTNPAKGTYPIDDVVNLTDTDGFWIVYTDTVNDIDFSQDVSGTLTITSNTNNQLKGTFEFSASSRETGETITVTNGKFSAAID